MATWALRSATSRAVAKPMPELPPSTKAVRPSNSRSTGRSFIALPPALAGLTECRHRLIGQGATGPRHLRPDIVAVLDLDGLDKTVLDPRDVFQHRGRGMPV